jgi:signal transduction histidine kinase
LNRRSVVLFFVLPFLGFVLVFSVATALQHRDLRVRTAALVRGQLDATAKTLSTAVSRFLDEGVPPDSALDTILADEEVYFVALLDAERSVLAWNSRFEGYLPISLGGIRGGEAGLIDSPAGQIFSGVAPLTTADGRRFHLYLGYALTGMEEMIAQSRRTALLLAGLVLLVGAAFFRGVYRLQSRYLAKAREAETERREKDHFREISAFTAGVAHEIKNPLNSLALVFELLGRKVPPEARGEVDLGKAQVRTIARIVDRFSRVLKAVRTDAETVLVDDVLRQAAESLAAEAPAAATRLRIEPAPGLWLLADRDLLVQALLNIFKNAVEASADAPVRAAARPARRSVEILIRDEGPGFPDGTADRLFEPFYTTKQQGMGIGLYLAKRIIEAHGGTIEARAQEGGGAEFRIILPGA